MGGIIMADIRDFFSSSGNQTTASMAYLLLMANVLGLAIFIDGKNGIQQLAEKPRKRDYQMKQTLKPVSSKSNKDIILEIADANELTIDKNVKNKSGENDTEFEQIDLAFKQKNIEISELRDNIINFKEAVALRNKEIKQPLKPLIWSFPEK